MKSHKLHALWHTRTLIHTRFCTHLHTHTRTHNHKLFFSISMSPRLLTLLRLYLTFSGVDQIVSFWSHNIGCKVTLERWQPCRKCNQFKFQSLDSLVLGLSMKLLGPCSTAVERMPHNKEAVGSNAAYSWGLFLVSFYPQSWVRSSGHSRRRNNSWFSLKIPNAQLAMKQE